ncbi:MAG: hypothetical protein AAFX46_22435, partial [Cyanobacteria bacterium J06636_27]
GRFDQVQQESTQQKRGQAVAKDATQGSEFNKFFPAASDGYQRVFTQEKKGFAQAKLKKDGKEVAKISVNDTTSNPSAAAKFDNSSKKISGYPAVERGKQTAVLVDNRYQVKIISSDPDVFTAADREAWLKKFDLSGLSRVKA